MCVARPPTGGGRATKYPFQNLHSIVRPPNLLIACTILPSSHSAPTASLPLPSPASNSSLAILPTYRLGPSSQLSSFKVVGARLYERWLLPGAQVAAAAPRCGLQARLARPARERCPLACAGVTSGGEGGQSEAALQLPWSTGALRHRRGGARSTAPSNLLGSFGSGSGRGAD